MSTVNNESFDRVTASARSYEGCLVPQTEAKLIPAMLTANSVGQIREFKLGENEYLWHSEGYILLQITILSPVIIPVPVKYRILKNCIVYTSITV